MTDSFPRQYARTQRLTLGEPRDVTVASDGSRLVFARSTSGSDPVNRLWEFDRSTRTETIVADPLTLVTADDETTPAAELARRERLREAAGGITAYATDAATRTAAFALAGHLYVTDLDRRSTTRLDVPGPVFDPRPSPGGDLIAYVTGRELWVTDLAGSARCIARPGDDEPDTVSWGSADFIAAEEMGRHRGFWWNPDGTHLAVCRVDDGPVPTWFISDPADPQSPPRPVRYPAAGTTNPVVSLHVADVGTGRIDEVSWDREQFEYLAAVHWVRHGLSMTVLSRDQRRLRVLRVDAEDDSGTGRLGTVTVTEDHDDAWVELVPGSGVLIGPSEAVTCADRDGARRLMVAGQAVSPADIQIRSILRATADRVVTVGNPLSDPTVQHVYLWTPDRGLSALTNSPGVHTAAVGGSDVIVRTSTLDRPGSQWTLPDGSTLPSFAEVPLVRPDVTVHVRAVDRLSHAVLFPRHHDGSPLPVLLDPYGGPHARRVVRSYNSWCTSQWFADQGFAVVVADGRGTPGCGSQHERAVHGHLADGVLDDQITALRAVADQHDELDLSRVAIRGWSFGGYLAALAVLRRPDVFHAAIAGAPVTEWRLYDTCYTERYLGHPRLHPDVYDSNSLIPLAENLTRPLLLIHGLADDNVVAAHTLRLSAALLAAGRPHEVLPLVGITHMTPQEVVAENLLLHQLDFLRRRLPPTDARHPTPDD